MPVMYLMMAEQSKNQTFYILDKYLFHATFEACLHCGRWLLTIFVIGWYGTVQEEHD